MKNYLKLIIIMAFINTGCSAQKNSITENINASANKQPLEDAVLQTLQAENDLVIAYAIENYAWARSIDYRILVQKNNEWKGYTYHKSLMPSGSPAKLSEPSAVDKAAAGALLNYMAENNAWAIPGDSENGFCADGNKSCNINDAPGARLWMITKTAAIAPAYYAAEFYEKCCPEKQRGLFVSIAKKINAIVSVKNAEE